ncbi:MAG: exodeoxyribonuclease VII large subunit [Lachnospiraceae bacterium]|nr:exodeoxyribonuclease VII large subunit [Lachnospiraceae bacterium]
MSNVYSVTQINGYIKNLFQQDFMLTRISIRGEVSNCKYHGSGHIYFTLKDQKSSLSCVMFASARGGLAFPMSDGDRVVVTGSVDIYERDGRYQMYARSIVKEGAGILYERFLALKAELEEMGMFSSEYKQPVPRYVRTVGIVTSPTGAAVQDIRNIAGRRNPFVQLILYPALVQGEGAVESICRGIAALDALDLDVIIVGRGGGSLEDLWAFNEEAVARAIFACNTPVISAVGHETDTSISDYVADLYAPTPSAAAELAVTDIREILERKEQYRRQLQTLMETRLREQRLRLEARRNRWNFLSPENQIREQRQRLADLEQRLETASGRILEEKRLQLQIRIGRLKGCSPLDRLDQGYSYTEKDSRSVKSIQQTKKGDLLTIHVRDGRILAEVKEISRRSTFPGETAQDED